MSVNIHQTAAISGNILYAKNEDEALYAVDATTGQLRWSFPLDSYSYTSPVIYNDSVIIADTNSVKAVHAISGTLKWEFDTLWDRGAQFYFGSPAVSGNTVYVHALHTITSTNASRIFALDVNTGDLVWQTEMPAALASSISVAAGVLYIGADDNKIYALDATNGDEIWSYPTGYYIRTFPAIANGRVIVASHDKKIYAFELP